MSSKVLVLGAGLYGLSCASNPETVRLAHEFSVFESFLARPRRASG